MAADLKQPKKVAHDQIPTLTHGGVPDQLKPHHVEDCPPPITIGYPAGHKEAEEVRVGNLAHKQKRESHSQIAKLMGASTRIPEGGMVMSRGSPGHIHGPTLCLIMCFLEMFTSFLGGIVMVDLGCGNGNVMLAALLVHGIRMHGIDTTGEGCTAAMVDMWKVCREIKASSKKEDPQPNYIECASALADDPSLIPPVHVITVQPNTINLIQPRLVALGVNVLYTFWGAWAAVEKVAALEMFRDEDTFKMFVVVDFSMDNKRGARAMYEGVDWKGKVYLHAVGPAAMKGTGKTWKDFKVWVYSKVDVPYIPTFAPQSEA